MLEGTVSIPLAFEPLKPHESINTLLDILFILPQYFYVYLSRNDAKKLRDMFLTTEPWNMNHETGRFGVPKPLTFKTRLSAKTFLWKRVSFAREWKGIFISMTSHLVLLWNRGLGQLGPKWLTKLLVWGSLSTNDGDGYENVT